MEKPLSYEENLMAKIAWYYYCEGLTQQQISDRLGISRMRVIKFLEKAKKTGIIQFKIRAADSRKITSEKQLMTLYGLSDCFIVPSPSNIEDTNENVAMAASMYIAARLTDKTFINIGYGDTLCRILNHLALDTEHPLSCVSLTGGVSYYLSTAHPNPRNTKLYLIPTPLLASSKTMADAMRNEASVREIQQMIPLASMTVIGIGGLTENATVIKSGALTKNDFLLSSMNGAVGDILCHFINSQGEAANFNIEDRLISTSLDTLKQLKRVIGVAAGLNKVEPIRAALHGKYINILITDEETAAHLIEGEAL